ncbi:MAG: hypothetical protein ABH879_01590 [archaeon]
MVIIDAEGIDRTECNITFHPHAIKRIFYWRLDPYRVEEAARHGKATDKCSPPKACFERYYGKLNTKYTVIIKIRRKCPTPA